MKPETSFQRAFQLGPVARATLGILLPFALPLVASAADAPHLSAREVSTQLVHVQNNLVGIEGHLKLVEVQYGNRVDGTQNELLSRRFSEGETEYLLGNYGNATVLLYDLVNEASFRQSDRYADALWYLGDGLFQQGSYLSAKVYLRELLELPSKHERRALARYLELAGRTNEFTGIEALINRARQKFGRLPPELEYVYGKWWFKRTDVVRAERLDRARAIFGELSELPDHSYRAQSLYFTGVIDVLRGKRKLAISQFEAATKTVGGPATAQRVRNFASLALGRLHADEGRLDAALEWYQRIPHQSEIFTESLYELAWVYVKRAEYVKAKDTIDLLLLNNPDTTLAPQAQLLLGHLLLKLQRYPDAQAAYTTVINTYQPVHDEMDALLRVNSDPVAYFDALVAKNEHHLDMTQLLPPVAAKWATAEGEVTRSVDLVSGSMASRRTIDESRQISQRVNAALQDSGLQTFPALQEGHSRANAVVSGLLRVDRTLLVLERSLVEDLLSPAERAQLDARTRDVAAMEQRFATLPTNPRELEARRGQLEARLRQTDQALMDLGGDLQSGAAILSAADKWVEDNRTRPKGMTSALRTLADQAATETQALAQLQTELDILREAMASEHARVDASASGEDSVREAYARALAAEHAVLETVEHRLQGEAAAAARTAHDLRARATSMTTRARGARMQVQQRVLQEARRIQAQVEQVQSQLDGYEAELTKTSQQARALMGQAAFDSFQKTRADFYELVLKADVGLVDVAFTRKQDKTSQIQKLSRQQALELQSLDDELGEVLKGED